MILWMRDTTLSHKLYKKHNKYDVITNLKKPLVCYRRTGGSSSLELELDNVSSCTVGLLGVVAASDFSGTPDVLFAGSGLETATLVLFVAGFFSFGL